MLNRLVLRQTLLLCCAICLSACIDTELGLDVMLKSGTMGIPAEVTEDITLSLDLNVRVGTFALNGNSFVIQRASVFSGQDPVAQLTLSRPSNFMGRLEPGESIDLTLTGMATADAFPQARQLLCTAGTARVVVDYSADSVPDDPTDPPIKSLGSAEGTVTVSCN